MEKDRWLRLGEGSSKGLAVKSENPCEPQKAAAYATTLLSCCRSSEASDPEMFVASVAANLARYPESVVRCVADPVFGLPAKNKWLPSIAEVREECDRIDGPRRRAAERDAQVSRQLAEREAWQAGAHRIPKDRWAGLANELGASGDPRRPRRILDARTAPTPAEREQAVEFHTQKLAALSERNRANPVKISDELVEKLGYLAP